jgi:hypothetical protein
MHDTDVPLVPSPLSGCRSAVRSAAGRVLEGVVDRVGVHSRRVRRVNPDLPRVPCGPECCGPRCPGLRDVPLVDRGDLEALVTRVGNLLQRRPIGVEPA